MATIEEWFASSKRIRYSVEGSEAWERSLEHALHVPHSAQCRMSKPRKQPLFVGLVLGLMLGYWPMRSSQNNMQEQVNRIEQYLAAQQPSTPAPAAPDVHAPTHKGKAK